MSERVVCGWDVERVVALDVFKGVIGRVVGLIAGWVGGWVWVDVGWWPFYVAGVAA